MVRSCAVMSSVFPSLMGVLAGHSVVKPIVSPEAAAAIIARNDPGPESLQLVTSSVAAPAGGSLATIVAIDGTPATSAHATTAEGRTRRPFPWLRSNCELPTGGTGKKSFILHLRRRLQSGDRSFCGCFHIVACGAKRIEGARIEKDQTWTSTDGALERVLSNGGRLLPSTWLSAKCLSEGSPIGLGIALPKAPCAVTSSPKQVVGDE